MFCGLSKKLMLPQIYSSGKNSQIFCPIFLKIWVQPCLDILKKIQLPEKVFNSQFKTKTQIQPDDQKLKLYEHFTIPSAVF